MAAFYENFPALLLGGWLVYIGARPFVLKRPYWFYGVWSQVAAVLAVVVGVLTFQLVLIIFAALLFFKERLWEAHRKIFVVGADYFYLCEAVVAVLKGAGFEAEKRSNTIQTTSGLVVTITGAEGNRLECNNASLLPPLTQGLRGYFSEYPPHRTRTRKEDLESLLQGVLGVVVLLYALWFDS